MKEEITKIRDVARTLIEDAKDKKTLNDIRVRILGKKGELTTILRGMANLSPEERPVIGNMVNSVKQELEEFIKQKENEFEEKELKEKLEKEKIDVTLPSTKVKRGSKHPINRTIEEIQDLFVSMGYDVIDGPELETDEFCFERLNLPKGHPARDMQDSFYITDEYLLRTQTSSVQARTMLANKEKSPIRMICTGKTYRREDDATHSHQFNQVEGLVIDKKENNVSLADLKGTLEVFVRKLIGENLNLRFRPSYFPFTEPSYEVDVTCFKCGGKGCNLCKQTGWIEVLGAGIVHPNVLKMNGYDPDLYGGFAFGTGIDRLAMFRYGITDMRYLYTNDTRFLKQFDRKDEE
ncbi:MAG: phenylalanine--tRNA ligase subunit alpha [Clostridia bacterium]|nr:phenylalanine--tRNA ligase subunit alpha [Clostridia bacterium]